MSPFEGQFPLAVDFVQVTFHLLLHLAQQVLVKVGVKNKSVIYNKNLPFDDRSCCYVWSISIYLWELLTMYSI